jgi:hypothetical protein
MSLRNQCNALRTTALGCVLVGFQFSGVLAEDAPAIPETQVQGVALEGVQAIDADALGLDATEFEQIDAIRELEALEQIRHAHEALDGSAGADQDVPGGDIYGRVRGGDGAGPRGPAGSPADGVFGSGDNGVHFGRPDQGDRDPSAIIAGLRSRGGGGGQGFNPYAQTSTGPSYQRGTDYGDGTRLDSWKRTDGAGGRVEYWLRRDTETGRTVSLTRIHIRADGSTETTIILKDERDGHVELVTHAVEDEEGTDTTRDRPGEESTYGNPRDD